MSIWSSIGDPLPGLDYDNADTPDAEPSLTVGVAWTWFPHARLAIRGHDAATILLKPAELRELAHRLNQAADICEKQAT